MSRPQGHGTVGRNTSLKNPVTPPGIDPGTVRLVAQRLNHYATPGPFFIDVLSLLHQTKAQCQLHINIRHVSPTCVGTRLSSSTRTNCLFLNRPPVTSCRSKYFSVCSSFVQYKRYNLYMYFKKCT